MLQRKRTNGIWAEDFASQKLSELGYKIITRNFRSRFGEIDIVTQKSGHLIFVEVKARWSDKFGSPEEAVTWYKLKKIQKTAEYFSLINPEYPKSLRIEVFALEVSGKNIEFKIIPVF